MPNTTEELLKYIRLEKRLLSVMIKEAEILYKKGEHAEQRMEHFLRRLEIEIEELNGTNSTFISDAELIQNHVNERLQDMKSIVQNIDEKTNGIKSTTAEMMKSIKRPHWILLFISILTSLFILCFSTMVYKNVLNTMQIYEKTVSNIEEHLAVPHPLPSGTVFVPSELQLQPADPAEQLPISPEPTVNTPEPSKSSVPTEHGVN